MDFDAQFHHFFFNDTATTEIYTLSLHDALPICGAGIVPQSQPQALGTADRDGHVRTRSEEHTSELQSRLHLVCRLLLEKKKTLIAKATISTAFCSLANTNLSRPTISAYYSYVKR